MPRRLVVTAEASKLYSRKARWSAYKRQMSKWLIDTLQLELHAYEIAGQLEGQCVFISTYHGARITGWVCTFDDKISVCVTSIRFDDGDGWRPGGGPRKPNFANLEIISGSSIRGGGGCWEIEQDYGDDIGAPGPLNGKLSEPMQLTALRDNVVSAAISGEGCFAGEYAPSPELPPLDFASRLASIRELLDLLLAGIGQSRVFLGIAVPRERATKLDALFERAALCRALVLKWFDATKSYGSTAHSSITPATASRLRRESFARVFISYRRADASGAGDRSGVVRSGLLERVVLAELVQQVRDVRHAWITTAGSYCDMPEALYLLSVLATDVSAVLARSSSSGSDTMIDEVRLLPPGRVGSDMLGSLGGYATSGTFVH